MQSNAARSNSADYKKDNGTVRFYNHKPPMISSQLTSASQSGFQSRKNII
jgi:hypothetical protein